MKYISLIVATSHARQLKVDFDMAAQDSIVIGHLTRNPESEGSNPFAQTEHE